MASYHLHFPVWSLNFAHSDLKLLCLVLISVMWHPSGDSSMFITLADSHILVCDIEPSGRTAKVCYACVLDY